MANITGKIGNFITDAGASVSNQIYKGAGKIGKDITLDTAQKIGYGITVGGMGAGALGATTNIDDGFGEMLGGSLAGTGLGAVSGAGIGAVAAAIAKGRR